MSLTKEAITIRIARNLRQSRFGTPRCRCGFQLFKHCLFSEGLLANSSSVLSPGQDGCDDANRSERNDNHCQPFSIHVCISKLSRTDKPLGGWFTLLKAQRRAFPKLPCG